MCLYGGGGRLCLSVWRVSSIGSTSPPHIAPFLSFSWQAIDSALQVREMMYHKIKLNKIMAMLTGQTYEQVSPRHGRVGLRSPTVAIWGGRVCKCGDGGGLGLGLRTAIFFFFFFFFFLHFFHFFHFFHHAFSCCGGVQIEMDTDRDNFLTPWEAVEYGLCDMVIDGDKEGLVAPIGEVKEPPKSKIWDAWTIKEGRERRNLPGEMTSLPNVK